MDLLRKRMGNEKRGQHGVSNRVGLNDLRGTKKGAGLVIVHYEATKSENRDILPFLKCLTVACADLHVGAR